MCQEQEWMTCTQSAEEGRQKPRNVLMKQFISVSRNIKTSEMGGCSVKCFFCSLAYLFSEASEPTLFAKWSFLSIFWVKCLAKISWSRNNKTSETTNLFSRNRKRVSLHFAMHVSIHYTRYYCQNTVFGRTKYIWDKDTHCQNIIIYF